MAESISFLFHTPRSIAYLLWLISFYHSSFNVNKDFLLSVIWFDAYLVPPTWVKKYYKWEGGSGGGRERGREERDFIVTFHVVIPIELRKCLAKSLSKKSKSQNITYVSF